ncbi:MAG: STAS-like domain-containing protein [Bacteroidales bacterium]|nr:STAS-like domain-containing protein [Bacteroidales bacterium]
MVTFSFIQFGENLGTRQLGKVAREKLMPLLNGDEKVILDFTGIDVVSNSFADECIAKLLIDMPLETLKARTTFKGLNPLAENRVLTAIKRRYAALCMA